MTDQQMTNELLADLIHEQQKTRLAITQLAEALAGIRREVVDEPEPAKPEPAPETPAAPTEEVTLADLRKTFAAQSKAGKKEELKTMLFNKFGAVKLTEVNTENYAELKQEALAL